MIAENIDYDNLKKRGFLRQKQEGFFLFRTRMSSGIYKKEQLDKGFWFIPRDAQRRHACVRHSYHGE